MLTINEIYNTFMGLCQEILKKKLDVAVLIEDS